MSNDTDVNGRPWAKLSELKVGDRLEADEGFTCLHKGDLCEVRSSHQGEFYVDCAEGEHHLLGQADDGEHLVGFYKVS